MVISEKRYFHHEDRIKKKKRERVRKNLIKEYLYMKIISNESERINLNYCYGRR